ncbi:MAG: hypothetical protein PUP92_21075 [Rhizonema sp. PD38]|nr:hypothetical protein [Rhizonema sp. PD38]
MQKKINIPVLPTTIQPDSKVLMIPPDQLDSSQTALNLQPAVTIFVLIARSVQ